MKKIKVKLNRNNSGAHLYDLELVALPPVGTVLFAPSPYRPDDSFPPRYFIVKEVIVDLVADPSGGQAILFVDPKERKLDWAEKGEDKQ